MKQPTVLTFIIALMFSSAVSAQHFVIPSATIDIDGNPNDWGSIEPAFVDAFDDVNPEAPPVVGRSRYAEKNQPHSD